MSGGKAVLGVGILVTALAVSACAGASAPPGPSASAPTSMTSSASPSESGQPATESNPPGDIPDNQAFVAFTPPGAAFSVKIPEGWASSTAGATTTFTDKLNQIQVSTAATATAPTAASVTATDIPAWRGQVPRFALGQVSAVTRQAGPAVLVTYQGDSPPNPVAGKVVRDAFEHYVFFHAGTRVDLTLSGPVNADNVDPWRTVTDSLRWQ
jgi:cytoskeletal protein RodZ